MSARVRPESIRKFERLFYLGLAVSAVNAWAMAAGADAHTYSDWSRPGYMLLSWISGTAINLLLLWLIAYCANNIARWIFIGLVAIGMIFMVAHVTHALDQGSLSLALTLAQYLLCAIEIALLFKPDSRGWFAGIRPIDPEIFR